MSSLVMHEDELKSMKRNELQKLAKRYNVKANMKNILIIEALLQIKANDDIAPLIESSKASEESNTIATDSKEKEKLDVSGCNFLDDSSLNLPNLSLNASLQESHLGKDITESSDAGTSESQNDLPTSLRNSPDGALLKTPENCSKAQSEADSKTFSVPKKTTKARTSSKENRSSMSLRKRKCNTVEKEPAPRSNKRKKAPEAKTDKSSSWTSLSSNIPRFVVSGVTTKSSEHKAFSRMESIDDYEKRKKERQQRLFGSNRKQSAAMSRLTKPKTPKLPPSKSSLPRPNIFSPNVAKRSNSSAKTEVTVKKDGFKPSILSTSKINTNFDKKTSKLAPPKRVSVIFNVKENAAKTPARNNRKSRASMTPFKPGGNVSIINTPQSTKKPKFDLKASLKKPLTYVPHKGPLKDFGTSEKKASLREKSKNMRKNKVTSRDQRRKQHRENKASVRDANRMKKRGIQV